LSTAGDWEREPEDEDKFEGVVEGEPVYGADGALKDGQESVNHPVCEPLCIISLAHAEQGLEGVISGDYESSKVHKKLATDVEEDEEEVARDQPKDSVGLRDRGLFLQIVQEGILGKLLIKAVNMPLGFVLERRHGEQ